MKKYVKCVECGWRYGNIYHICKVWPIVDTLGSVTVQGRTFFVSQEHREKIKISQQERWERFRQANKDRDNKIVERYLEGDVSYEGVANEFGISRSTVVKVIKNAKKGGLDMPRKPGQRTGIAS